MVDVILQLFAHWCPTLAHICSLIKTSPTVNAWVFTVVPDAKWPCMNAVSKDLSSLITLLGHSSVVRPCCYSSISCPLTHSQFSLSGISVINWKLSQLPMFSSFVILRNSVFNIHLSPVKTRDLVCRLVVSLQSTSFGVTANFFNCWNV